MRNHACNYAKYCADYSMDQCEGCSKAVPDSVSRLKNQAIEKLKSKIATDLFRRPMSSTKGGETMKIKKVIFNEPTTVVLWQDGTKTLVRCQKGDTYSKETGLAVAIAKKALGNKGNFNEVFKKWIPGYGKDGK